ncbi:MAG: branched-chain amino acid ABC transporter permease [Firmicutes bacterium]|nr:branched-chain amino acid ABC transporter permease [Bacillota bacterium]
MPHTTSPTKAPSTLRFSEPYPAGHFRQGLRMGLPIAFGYFPTALAFGVVALEAGLSAKQAMLISALVFSGAGQFMAANLVAAGAAPMAIIVSNLVVNLRYFVMSASLSRRLHLSWLQAGIIGFGITDETFVMNYFAHPDKPADSVTGTLVESEQSPLPASLILGVNIMAYVGWVAGTYVGTIFAGVLPAEFATGMGVVLYAMFIALLIPAVARSLGVGAIAAAGGGCCWLLNRYLPFGWAMILATTMVAGLGAWCWGKGVDEL